MDRYRVVRDLQGGEFGMGRDFTIEQWRKNALEWCYSDDSYGLAKELYELKSEDVLGYIAEVWALEFKKVRKDKKIDQSDIDAYEDETLDEFYHTRFDYMQEDEDELADRMEDEYWKDKIQETANTLQVYLLADDTDREVYRVLAFDEKIKKTEIQDEIDKIKQHFYDEDYDGWIIDDVLEELAKKYDFEDFGFDRITI